MQEVLRPAIIMRKFLKKTLSLFLVFVLFFSIIPTIALAKDYVIGDTVAIDITSTDPEAEFNLYFETTPGYYGQTIVASALGVKPGDSPTILTLAKQPTATPTQVGLHAKLTTDTTTFLYWIVSTGGKSVKYRRAGSTTAVEHEGNSSVSVAAYRSATGNGSEWLTVLVDGSEIPTDLSIVAVFSSGESTYSASAVSDDDSMGGVSVEDQGDNSFFLTAIPNVGYAFDHWEMTTATEPDDSDWSVASEVNEMVYTAYTLAEPYVKSTTTASVTADTQFRAHFRPSQMILQDGYITACSSLPEKTLEQELDEVIRAWTPGLTYAPSKKSVSVGSPARLYINWWADAPIANYTNATISLYVGSEAQGTPLYSITKPLRETSPANQLCSNPNEKPLGYVFDLYFTMPDTETMTVSIQLEGRDPIVQTYSTGITREMDRLRAEYSTLENLRYRYLIDKALDSAAVEIANTTDSTEIADIISKTESQIQAYLQGTDTSYIEVSFDNTLVYVPENIQQTYAFCAALEQVYPREKGFWYLDYAGTQFGVWLNGYGGRLFTESELGPDGIAHTDDDGPLETEITTYSKTWAAGEALPTSGMVSGKQYGGLQYNVNGFYADFGMSGWLVSEDEQFTWGPDDTAGYDPLYTIPHTSGSTEGEKQLKWATMVLHREGVTLADITERLGDVSDKTADEVYPLLREAFSDQPYADRLVWNLPSNFTENAYVKDAYAKCSALTPESGAAEIQAAQAAYDAIPNTEFGSKIWRTHYFVKFEPYKTAYEKLTSRDSTPVVTTDPDVALAGVLNYLKTKVTSPAIGSVNGEWALLAMARGGVVTDEAKAAYLANLDAALADGTGISKYTDYERVTLALSALGIDASQYGSSAADLTAAYQAYVSLEERSSENQTLMADIFALIALNSKPYSGDQSSYVEALCHAALTDGGWNFTEDATAADVDTTAMAIQALAPYYSTDSRVKEKVDAALVWLKTKQDTASGAFTGFDGTVSTCSTAQVVTALCAIGQDPTGTQWTVGSTNPVLGLTVYYIADTGAFGESSASTASQMSTEQAAYALVAYKRFQDSSKSLYDMRDAFGGDGEVTDPGEVLASAKQEIETLGQQTVSMKAANTEDQVKTYLDTRLQLLTTKGPSYEIQVTKLVPAVAGTEEAPKGTNGSFAATITMTLEGQTDTVDISGDITATPYEAPLEHITVAFRLLGDTHHEIASDSDIHSYRFNAEEMPVWIEEGTVTLAGGSSVGDLFRQVLDEKGYTYAGLEQDYISTITQPGDGISLTAMDDSRKNSGWMYLVNGKHPDVGLNSYILSDGDLIVWHWSDDYRIEEGSELWGSNRVPAYIENLIKAIGTVDSSDDCKARIGKARAAYDKLTEEEKEKVGNYQTLLEAEALTQEGYILSAAGGASIAIGQTATISIQVNNRDETTYNSYAFTVSYDTEKLAYTGINTDASVKEENGLLTIAGYGADKICGTDPVVLTFTGKAVGQANVTVTQANIDKSENVNVQDAPEATIAEASTAITVTGYQVTLSDDLTGESTVEPGANYTFYVRDPHYTYGLQATMGGYPAAVGDNGDGSYTIWRVRGDLVIKTWSKTPKTYTVRVEGTGKDDLEAAASATYLTDYSFRLTKDDSYTYQVSVKIDGQAYTPTLGEDAATYTIAGADVTGAIVITVNKEAKPVTTSQINFTGSGSGDVQGGTTQTGDNGADFIFELNADPGFTYTVTLDGAELTAGEGGKYTIPGARLTGQPITVTVEKTPKSQVTVDVYEYIKLNGKSMWLVTAAGTLSQGKVVSYEGNAMFWSAKYDAYCYLVISDQTQAQLQEEAPSKVAEASAVKVSIAYDSDINKTGLVDVNDAQLTYNMYNGQYESFEEVSMEKFLEADVNGDKTVSTLDAAAIISSMLGA